MERIDWLIQYLLEEDPQQYNLLQLPKSMAEKRDLFRALRNVRPPRPASETFLRLQDEELQAQMREKGIVEISDVVRCNTTAGSDEPTVSHPTSPQILLWQGDITRLRVDAIVNAANSRMLGCWAPLHHCIDNAIHSAAGIQLREACAELMQAQGHEEPTGSAKITLGFNLPCRHVIHTVGPIIADGIPTARQQAQLASCYRSILELAWENNLESIAFCCISTGEFRFPNQLAAATAIQTVRDFLTQKAARTPVSQRLRIRTIIFNVFKEIDLEIYRQLLSNAVQPSCKSL